MLACAKSHVDSHGFEDGRFVGAASHLNWDLERSGTLCTQLRRVFRPRRLVAEGEVFRSGIGLGDRAAEQRRKGLA